MSLATLGGCVENFPDAKVARGDVRGAIARGEMRSPRSAAIALASIEGAPEPVLARFKAAMATEAAGREITITDPTLARYLIRGYLNAYPTEAGTSVHYVWDVFDAEKHRTQRLDDDVSVPGTAADPWSVVDEKVLTSLAARSTDDIATYLATTPEAASAPRPHRGRRDEPGAAAS